MSFRPIELAKVMAGMKTGKKENPKPLVEKDRRSQARRRCRRQDHREGAGRDRDRAAAAAEGRGKAGREETRPAEGRREAQRRAEAGVGREEARSGQASTRSPRRSRRKRRSRRRSRCRPPSRLSRRSRRSSSGHFDQSQIAALLDKRDPSRQAAAGDTLNSNAALGLAKGTAADNSATWGCDVQASRSIRCWKKPYGGIEAAEVRGRVRHPVSSATARSKASPVPEGAPATPTCASILESALARDHRMPALSSLPPAFLRGMEICSRRCSDKV